MSIEELIPNDSYTAPGSRPRAESAHHDEPAVQQVIGIRPLPPRLSADAIKEVHVRTAPGYCSVSIIIWCVLVGWWVALFYFVSGILFLVTIVGYRHALFCFRMGSFVIFPFGRYAAKSDSPPVCENMVTRVLSILFMPIYGLAALLGIVVSWEFVYYIPMSKFLWQLLVVGWECPSSIQIFRFENQNPQRGHRPVLLAYSAGGSIYLTYSVRGFEVIYLNFWPFVLLAFVSGFFVPKSNPLYNGLFGACMGILGAVPCAYMLGVCVDELSHQLGLVLGAILNSVFLTVVELILYFFSLERGMVDAVRSAVTGAFLMNLLVIPGFGMLAAGLKWNEVILNKKSQSISGTFLLLSVGAILLPSMFYHIHSETNDNCQRCHLANWTMSNFSNFRCDACRKDEYKDITEDPVYKQHAGSLMVIMACGMPVMYIIAVWFSLKSHAHIFQPAGYEDQEVGPAGAMNKWVAIALLIFATLVFVGMAHVITDKIPAVIQDYKLSERFVGLVFYTLIPNAAEYMNAIKFAINGNIGLSMEIGNQGAILTALVEMPALVLMSYIQHKINAHTPMFTLVFPVIDIFVIIVAVLLRNSILIEKAITYFTGTSFLIIFGLICVVYYFEVF
jgi:Ca2+:H+ antiporter